MSLNPRFAAAIIKASARFGSSRLAAITPFELASRFAANRIVPRAARAAFTPGTHQVNGVQMMIPEPGNGAEGGEYHMALETYEPREIAYLQSRLRPGGGLIDVGAHIGYFSLAAAACVGPTGRVVAFEPTARSAAVLRESVALNGFEEIVHLVEGAASSATGTGQLVISDISPMWNTLEPDTLVSHSDSIEVELHTVDEILESLNWPHIDILKMDAEGHEGSVLLGASRTFERYPDIELVFEICGATPERRSVSLQTMMPLAEQGWSFFSFVDDPSVERSIDWLTARMDLPNWQDSLLNVIARRT